MEEEESREAEGQTLKFGILTQRRRDQSELRLICMARTNIRNLQTVIRQRIQINSLVLLFRVCDQFALFDLVLAEPRIHGGQLGAKCSDLKFKVIGFSG